MDLTRCGLLASALLGTVTPARAQMVGTVIVAHGADSAWNAAVLDMARGVHTGGPVHVSFLMGPAAPLHRFQDVVDTLAASGVTTIVVVPLLVSSHGGHYEQVRYLTGVTDTLIPVMREHLDMAGIERPHTAVPLVLSPALDDAPELAQVLTDRAAAMTTTPRAQTLFLIGHGPNSAEEKAAWMGNLRPLAETVRARAGFHTVHVGLVRDDAPEAVRADAVYEIRELITLEAQLTGKPVVVVPILIARGEVSTTTVPHDLEGLPITYRGSALLPHPALARWVERRVRESVTPTALH
jgi:sirohydrochlorin cobaltochelatase